jgi:hypothetical protein
MEAKRVVFHDADLIYLPPPYLCDWWGFPEPLDWLPAKGAYQKKASARIASHENVRDLHSAQERDARCGVRLFTGVPYSDV